MFKFKSYYFILILVILTILYSFFLFAKGSLEYDNVYKFFLISFIFIELSYYLYSKWKYYKNNWIKIGRYKYNFTGYVFIMILIIIFLIIMQLFIYAKNKEFPDFYFYFITFICFLNIKQLNYHLIIKKYFLSIIENDNFQDYSKSDIKYIAIKNNNLAIALMKSDKVFNFPIEDFKENELEELNKFIKVENLEVYK